MSYNPTVTFVADILELANGEPGEADVFNRPIEQLDSRTLYLKQEIEANDGELAAIYSSLGTAISDIGILTSDISALSDDLTNLSAESIAWPGSATIPSASDLAAAVELAAQSGGGGGGTTVTVRFGATTLAGTVITHNLGDTNHAVSIQLATIATMTPEQAANVGEFYVVRGANADTVYSTGGLEGILFDYTATPFATSGTILAGTATFGSLTGTLITHNLGNDVHSTQVLPSDTSAIAASDAANIGATYIVRGVNSDTIYNTGPNNTVPFTYIIS